MEPEVMILLSGGVDSAACTKFYLDFGRPSCGLFIDYGQPAAIYEVKSAIAIAKHYSIPIKCLVWRGWQLKTAGLIPGRNFFLLSAALMEKPDFVSVIAMGIHAGTNYPDCSKTFWARMQAVVDVYEHCRIQLAAPFLSWSKSEIYAYSLQKGVPFELTYSCERGGTSPCGECLSCKDREMLNALT